MRFAVVGLALFAAYASAVAGAVHAAPQDKPKTTSDGVYSDDQAKRGADAYAKSCASCHGADLNGLDTAPSLTGKDFNASWADQTLDDLFERARTTMPADAPGSLSPQQYADIVAFILSKDSFPAGSADLPADNAALKQIKFVAQKP
jgi:mono/diheme cytochrome c family protein